MQEETIRGNIARKDKRKGWPARRGNVYVCVRSPQGRGRERGQGEKWIGVTPTVDVLVRLPPFLRIKSMSSFILVRIIDGVYVNVSKPVGCF
jgi:hypothetical protein